MTAKRILVVDNEPYIREVTQICLETVAGWEVLSAASGREAIERAQRDRPDVILLDVMMPDMDGITTFQQLQANPQTQVIPILLLTAKVQASDYHRYKELGIKATIAKPFNCLQLASQISEALGWTFEGS
jgi:CheY-like chemotaxis protein